MFSCPGVGRFYEREKKILFQETQSQLTDGDLNSLQRASLFFVLITHSQK